MTKLGKSMGEQNTYKQTIWQLRDELNDQFGIEIASMQIIKLNGKLTGKLLGRQLTNQINKKLRNKLKEIDEE